MQIQHKQKQQTTGNGSKQEKKITAGPPSKLAFNGAKIPAQ
jgi:hypothetical protein